MEQSATQILDEACASRRSRSWCIRYSIARTPEEALTATEDARLWVEELSCNIALDHEGQHCVAEALRDLRTARVFLRDLIHQAAKLANATDQDPRQLALFVT